MEHAIQVSLDNSGNIVIPSTLRKKLQLKPGMTLVVEKTGKDELRLRVQEPSASLVEKDGLLVVRASAIGDLDEVARRERDERMFDLLQRGGL